jgi:SPP1 family predicted phage head-tail adaptor
MYNCDKKCKPQLGSGKRHSIDLQTVSEVNNAGEVTETWSTICTKRASIEPIQGREYWDGKQTLADQNFVIKIDYDATAVTITTKGRILFGSRIFDIQTKANPGEMNEELHFICKERL